MSSKKELIDSVDESKLDDAEISAQPKRSGRDDDHPAVTRAARRSPGDEAQSLKFSQIPGYHTLLVTIDDPKDPTRQQRRLAEWYEPVLNREIPEGDQSKPDEPVLRSVGSSNGQVLHGMLMKLPIELFDKDMADADKKRKSLEVSSKSTPTPNSRNLRI